MSVNITKFIEELKTSCSQRIVDKIFNDLTDRKGFDELWYSVDMELRENIKRRAREIIETSIDKAYARVVEC